MDITDKSVTYYLDSKYRAVDERLIPFRNLGEKDRVPIIRKDTENFLRMLIELTHPHKIFEIGTAIGYSAAFFAIASSESIIVTCDTDEYAWKAAKRNLEVAGVSERVRALLGDGTEIADKLYDEGEDDFDFIFIDASKSHYRNFLDASLRIAKKGATIVTDNILQHGMTASKDFDPKGKHVTNIKNMRMYVDHLLYANYLDSFFYAIGDGIAVSLYRGEGKGPAHEKD